MKSDSVNNKFRCFSCGIAIDPGMAMVTLSSSIDMPDDQGELKCVGGCIISTLCPLCASKIICRAAIGEPIPTTEKGQVNQDRHDQGWQTVKYNTDESKKQEVLISLLQDKDCGQRILKAHCSDSELSLALLYSEDPKQVFDASFTWKQIVQFILNENPGLFINRQDMHGKIIPTFQDMGFDLSGLQQ